METGRDFLLPFPNTIMLGTNNASVVTFHQGTIATKPYLAGCLYLTSYIFLLTSTNIDLGRFTKGRRSTVRM